MMPIPPVWPGLVLFALWAVMAFTAVKRMRDPKRRTATAIIANVFVVLGFLYTLIRSGVWYPLFN